MWKLLIFAKIERHYYIVFTFQQSGNACWTSITCSKNLLELQNAFFIFLTARKQSNVIFACNSTLCYMFCENCRISPLISWVCALSEIELYRLTEMVILLWLQNMRKVTVNAIGFLKKVQVEDNKNVGPLQYHSSPLQNNMQHHTAFPYQKSNVKSTTIKRDSNITGNFSRNNGENLAKGSSFLLWSVCYTMKIDFKHHTLIPKSSTRTGIFTQN